MKTKSLAVALILFLLGLLIILIPSFSGHRLESQAEQAAERFNETVLENKNEESPSFTELEDGDLPYPELFGQHKNITRNCIITGRRALPAFRRIRSHPYVFRITALMTGSSGRYASPSLA